MAPQAQYHPHGDAWAISYRTGISMGLEKCWSNSSRGLLINTCATPVMCQTLHRTEWRYSVCKRSAGVFARTACASCQAPAGPPVPPNQHPWHRAALPGKCRRWLGSDGAGRDLGQGGQAGAGQEEAKAVGARGKRRQELLQDRGLPGAFLQPLPPSNLSAEEGPTGATQEGTAGLARRGDQAAPRMASSPQGAQPLVGVSPHTRSSPWPCFTTRGLGREGRRAPCGLNTALAMLPSPAIIL